MMKFVRVMYGKKNVPIELREYQLDGSGPVGTRSEIKEFFPNEELEFIERDGDLNTDSTFRKSLQRSMDSGLPERCRWVTKKEKVQLRKGGKLKPLSNKKVKGRGAGWHEQRLNHSKASVKGKMKKWRTHGNR